MTNRYLIHIVGFALLLFNQLARSAEVTDFNLQLSTREGVSRDGEHALAEYRAQVEGSWIPAAAWRIKAKAGVVTERRLDNSPYTEAPIDELYVSYQGEPCTVRAGIQQVVWGRADRLQVLDVIHPMDLRESYFGDWDRKRLPLGMLNTECVGESQSLQLLLVPQTRYHRTPSPQGRFAVPAVADNLRAQNVQIQDDGKPNAGDPSNWSAGAQWSGRLGDADVTLNAYHGWQPEPVLRPIGLTYRSEAARFTMWGGSFMLPVGPVVVRGEGALRHGMTAYTSDATGQPQPLSVKQRTHLLGVDYQNEPWFFSVQYFGQRTISDEQLLAPKRAQIMTVAVRRSLLQDRLRVTAYIARDLERPANYLSLEARYEINSHLLGRLSIERFSGDVNSFGRFSQQGRIMFGLEYSFK